MTAQDLKNAILQLAVQGKLVPQDMNDEPASALLKQISAKKERLVKEGKIKKEKNLPEITEEDVPFDIPASWRWLRLGDFCAVYNGDSINATVKQEKYSKPCDGWDFIATKDIGFDHVINYQNGIRIPFQEADFKVAPAGSVLLCMEGGSAGKKIGILNKDVCFGNKLCCFVPIAVFNKYLYYYLQSPQFFSAFMGSMTGLIGGVGAAKLKSIVIPLPPLAEQQRIVAKIEELMPLVEEYSKAEERLTALNAEFPDKLRKSILQQAIQGKLTEREPADEPASELLKRIRAEKERLIKEGKIKKEKPLPPITEEEMPFEIPEGWEWVRLGDLGETQTGTTPSTKDSRFFGKDIPFIKPADIFFDHINYDNEGLSCLGSKQSRIIQANSVMMVCIGGSIGKTYHNDRDVCCNQQINTITPIQCNTVFIWLVLSSNYFFEALQVRATGTATPIVNKNLWCNIPVPLPPLAEQQRIVDRVNELLTLCNELK